MKLGVYLGCNHGQYECTLCESTLTMKLHFMIIADKQVVMYSVNEVGILASH
jgi:hypothetical protein